MPCRSPCSNRNGRYSYTFVNQPADFRTASTGCGARKTLASNLSIADYRTINGCCDQSQNAYRIGLVADKNCRNHTTKYSWVTNVRKCGRVEALNLQPPQPIGCETAAINAGSPNNNILNARWYKCQDMLPYICQEKRRTTTTRRSTTIHATTQSTTTPATSLTTTATPNMNPVRTSSPALSVSTKRNNANLMSSQAATASINSAAIVGTIVGILFILILLLLFLIFRRSKKCEAVKQGIRSRASSYFSRTVETDTSDKDTHYKVMSSERTCEPGNSTHDIFNSHDFRSMNHQDANLNQSTEDNNPYAVVCKSHKTRRELGPEASTDDYAAIDASAAGQQNTLSYDLENQFNPNQSSSLQSGSPTPDPATSAVYAVVNKTRKKATAKTTKTTNENEPTDVYAIINKTKKK